MRVYADSSFILRLVTAEPGSEEAIAEYRHLGRPVLLYLPLHALEVENAIYQRAFHERRTRPAAEGMRDTRARDAALARLAQLRARGALSNVALDMDPALERALELSRTHGERLGARAIDLAHVACALQLGSELFLTFDRCQQQLAAAAGLKSPKLQVPR